MALNVATRASSASICRWAAACGAAQASRRKRRRPRETPDHLIIWRAFRMPLDRQDGSMPGGDSFDLSVGSPRFNPELVCQSIDPLEKNRVHQRGARSQSTV